MDSGLINMLPYLNYLQLKIKPIVQVQIASWRSEVKMGRKMQSILLKLYFNLQFLASIFFFQVPTAPLTSISSICQTLNLSTSR
jgi:hypothetical protein